MEFYKYYLLIWHGFNLGLLATGGADTLIFCMHIALTDLGLFEILNFDSSQGFQKKIDTLGGIMIFVKYFVGGLH